MDAHGNVTPSAGRKNYFFIHLTRHFERTFDLWNIRKPSPEVQIKRSLIFVSSLLATIFWPSSDLLANFLFLLLVWIMLGLTEKPVSRWLLMFNLMLNVTWLYLLMKWFLEFSLLK